MTFPWGCLASTINPSRPYWLSRLRITGVKNHDESLEGRVRQRTGNVHEPIRLF